MYSSMITTRQIQRSKSMYAEKMKQINRVALIILILSVLIFGQNWRFCLRVVDGDTIVLDGNEKVRLIGVDTPETKDAKALAFLD